jgi:hypothetical protein
VNKTKDIAVMLQFAIKTIPKIDYVLMSYLIAQVENGVNRKFCFAKKKMSISKEYIPKK